MQQLTVIIGGGIAGLTTAWRLHEAGLPVIVLEQSSSVGGCIRTMHEHGYMLELGPNTFLNSSKALWNLAESLDLKELKISSPEKVGKKRYIYKKDGLVTIPSGPSILFSSVLSRHGRVRLLKERFIKEKSQDPDESLASFVRRRFGEEVLNTLVTPFVSGIYAGDPEKLSLRAIFPKLADIEKKYGSVFKGMSELKSDIKSSGLGSFKAGIGTLPMAIESRLKNKIIKRAKVTSVEKVNSHYKISFEDDGEGKNIIAKNLVFATPAYSTAKLASGLIGDASKTLKEISYAPIVVVHTGHKETDVPLKLDGFGFLVPRKQRARLLGCLWTSSLFDGRADKGKVLLTNFYGGMLDEEAMELTNDDILRTLQKDLSRTLNIKGKPDFVCITRYMHAIPQYEIGHLERIAKINAAMNNHAGLHLTGAYLNGISVASTIEHSEKVASMIKEGAKI